MKNKYYRDGLFMKYEVLILQFKNMTLILYIRHL
jgi:hypothetical protein